MACKSKYSDKRFELTIKLNNGTLAFLYTVSYPFAQMAQRLLKKLPCVEFVNLVSYPLELHSPMFDNSSVVCSNDIPY